MANRWHPIEKVGESLNRSMLDNGRLPSVPTYWEKQDGGRVGKKKITSSEPDPKHDQLLIFISFTNDLFIFDYHNTYGESLF